MYENISELRPYFFSLREINNNVSLDIKIPTIWEYNSVVEQYKSIGVKVQDKNETNTLLSVISAATREGYELVFSCCKEIIKKNREEEEKARLFREKVAELEKLFVKTSLEDLKSSFNSTIKLIQPNGENQDDSGGAGQTGESETEG